MSYDYSYCPLVRAPDLVWPLRLPIMCHVVQSHVIHFRLDHQSRHIVGIFKMTRICRQYVGNWLIQHSSWLIQLKRHSNEYATNISGGVASIATNTYLICQNRTTIANIFSLPCIIHREAEFKSFSSLLGFCAAWSFASGKRSFDRIYDYQVRT